MSQKFLNPIEVDGQVSAEYLDLSTSTSHSVNAGEIAWNSIDGTFDIGLLNGVTLQAGQEMHFYGKATEAISNGNAVMFAGVQGDHILIAKADAATINANPEYFMGVATQDFAINDFGYVTAFGNVRGIDTSTYSLGDILYYDSTSATDGLLTPIIPLAPKAKIIVAAVVKVHTTQGILAVRPHTMPRLKDIRDINVDTASVGEILQLQSDGVWENKTLSEAGIQPTLTNPVTGTGTTNYVAKFTGTTSLGNSQIFDNGTNVGIGTTTPFARLNVRAQGTLSTDIAFRVRNSADTADMIIVRGNGDVFIGLEAGKITTVGGNTIMGNSALRVNTSGYNNAAFGLQSLYSNTTGFSNTAVGVHSLFSNTTGTNNTALGIQSLNQLTSGDSNLALGASSAQKISDGNNLTSSTNSIFIGRDTRANANNQTNQIVIGDQAIGLGSNTVVLGNDSIVTTALKGNVGIGTTSPQARLDIRAQGSLSTDIAFRVRNSADNGNLIEVRGDNQIRVLELACVTTFSFRTFSQSSDGFTFSQQASTTVITSGIYNLIRPVITFQPTSGTAIFNTINISPQINQTGGASGVTRGLFLNPNLQTAADWRSIEWSNNTGRGLWGSGTANNAMAGSLNVGVAANANASAILELTSTARGFLPPRMTTTQRNAIATPAAGLVVYDTTDNKHYGYNGTTWNAFY